MQKSKRNKVFLFALILVFSCRQHEKPNRPMNIEWPHAVTYEIFVQSFADSNDDGIGDINGVRAKLDYLVDLGVKAIWLMPINPSPSYHKYDVTNYQAIHPDYGTIDDFKALVKEAHEKGIAIIIDLVINHCSSQHPWFQQSLNPESQYRDFFIWKDLASIKEENILLKTKTGDSDNIKQWNELADQEELYYSFFWSGMPDLNYDNPKVRSEIYTIGKFWLDNIKVDGFRLDAAKHIYPDDRAADNHAFWKEFKSEIQQVAPDVYLIGEVWDDLETQVPYAEGFSSLFNFDLAFSILESVKRGQNVSASIFEDAWKVDESVSLITVIKESEKAFRQKNPTFINGTFLTNHDQNRVYSFLNQDEEKAKLAASILFTIPGAPYIYYGEELGMAGMKPDPNIREPMIWSNDHDGFRTSWIEPIYALDEKLQGIKEQQADPQSMYNHYRTLIHLRNKYQVLSRGEIADLSTTIEDNQILIFSRKHDNEQLVIFHNLSSKTKTISNQYDNNPIIWSSSLIDNNKALTLRPYSTLIINNSPK